MDKSPFGVGSHFEFLVKLLKRKRWHLRGNYFCNFCFISTSLSDASPPRWARWSLLFGSRRRNRLANLLPTEFHTKDPLHLPQNDVVGDPPARICNLVSCGSWNCIFNLPSSFVVVDDLRFLVNFGSKILLTQAFGLSTLLDQTCNVRINILVL